MILDLIGCSFFSQELWVNQCGSRSTAVYEDKLCLYRWGCLTRNEYSGHTVQCVILVTLPQVREKISIVYTFSALSAWQHVTYEIKRLSGVDQYFPKLICGCRFILSVTFYIIHVPSNISRFSLSTYTSYILKVSSVYLEKQCWQLNAQPL